VYLQIQRSQRGHYEIPHFHHFAALRDPSITHLRTNFTR
jgi:hypothetical protein